MVNLFEANKPETISQLTSRIKNTLEQNFFNVWAEGEISNFKIMSTSAHAYFTLKDGKAAIACTFFGFTRSSAAKLNLRDGVKIRVRGSISLFEPRGSYQINVRSIEIAGQGDLKILFEQLKQKLLEEGLFNKEHKRPLPLFPSTIGIVTSPTGAAIRDMLNVTRRRFAGIKILLASAKVQGEGAAEEIVNSIKLLNELPTPPDVIIVGRGGGSIEDLWCFNEEIVARAIYNSKIPIISAVGHETDFTISDFVADLRAPTPSAAAELVVGQAEELAKSLSATEKQLNLLMNNKIRLLKQTVYALKENKFFNKPQSLVNKYQQQLDTISISLEAAIKDCIQKQKLHLSSIMPSISNTMLRTIVEKRISVANNESNINNLFNRHITNTKHTLEKYAIRLNAANPKAILSKGYSIVRDSNSGKIIKNAKDISVGSSIETEFAKDKISSVVTKINGQVNDGTKPKHNNKTKATDNSQQELLF